MSEERFKLWMFELIPIFENVQEVYQKALIFSTFINLSRWSDFEDLFISTSIREVRLFFLRLFLPQLFVHLLKFLS